jgi:predicted HTH transcriptional regulator
MLPPLPSDEELATLQTFPIPEGQHWEYKETVISSEKLLQNICAFLNRRGGYLIIGIRDIDLAIIGIPETVLDKTIDSFILKCDNIYHQSLIVSKDRLPVNPECIVARRVMAGTRRLVIISVEPEKGKEYICHDGTTYIRLSASNYKLPSGRYYTEHDIHSLEGTIKSRYTIEYASTIANLEHAVRSGQSKTHKLEIEMDVLRSLLYSKILQEKTEAEAEKKTTKGLWCCVFGLSW